MDAQMKVGVSGMVRHFFHPQKVISFDHFLQENANFFLILLKVGEGEARWKDILLGGGQLPPKPPHSYTTDAMERARQLNTLFMLL